MLLNPFVTGLARWFWAVKRTLAPSIQNVMAREVTGVWEMNSTSVVVFSVFVSLVAPCLGYAQQDHGHDAPSSVEAVQLSQELRQILIQEMMAIQDGMQALVPAIAAGNWHGVAEIGRKIDDSYIMKQKLSASQMEELHRSLPAGFQELDQNFHHFAAMLAHTAKMKNSELVSFYFYKLTEACTACHAKYASHRFPGLARGPQHEERH